MLDFLSTYSVWGMWFLQFAVGAVFIYHGWPKLKNIKKFFGVGGTAHGLIEVTAASLLILNVFVRGAGLVLAIIMLGAIWLKKFKWGIPFSPEFAPDGAKGTGWEFDFVLLAANLFFLLG